MTTRHVSSLLALTLSAGAAHAQNCIWMPVSSGATTPSARYLSAVAYDPVRSRVVLFGGKDGAANLGDTWEWDGASWTLKATTGPKARAGHSMAYHGGLGKVILYGGTMAAPVEGRTWQWDGTSWTAFPEDNGAFSPSEGAMVYDEAHQKLLLLNGLDSLSTFTTHDLDPAGTGWWRVVDIPSPPRRVGCAAAYDSDRAKVVFYGATAADVWEFDGAGPGSWTRVANGPPGRAGAAMAYDPVRHRMILTGGTSGIWSLQRGDVWEYDGFAWVRRADDGPGPRTQGWLVFDAARSTMLFGMGRFGQTPWNELWKFEGGNTQSVLITQEPPLTNSPSGYPLSLTVGSQGAQTFQWYHDDVALEDDGRLSGTHTPILTLSPLQVSDRGTYRLQMTGSCGAAALVFHQDVYNTSCYANCDGSTSLPVITANDYQCFLNAFAARTSYANCDGSTVSPVLTANDFQCFLGRAAVGCE